MDLIVYMNGNFVKASEAKVSIYDHGFLYGDGVFETLRAYKKHVFKYQEHIQRLCGSLKKLGMKLPISPSVIFKATRLLLQYNQIAEAYIRVTVTRGEGPIGLDTSLCSQPTLLVVAEPQHKYPAHWYVKGISVIISSYRKLPDVCLRSDIKSCNYLPNIVVKKEVNEKQAQEGILLNIEGYITEGSVSNIFIVKDKYILTPAGSSGILNGITRQTVIELAENRGLEVSECHLQPKEIFTADECFLTNTSMEIMPVTYCDGTQIKNGKLGRVTRALMKDFKKYVERTITQDNE